MHFVVVGFAAAVEEVHFLAVVAYADAIVAGRVAVVGGVALGFWSWMGWLCGSHWGCNFVVYAARLCGKSGAGIGKG